MEKKRRKEEGITDVAVLSSLSALGTLVEWAEKTKKSLTRAKKSIKRAQERHAKSIEQVPNLLKDETRDPDNIRWIVTPHSLNGVLRTIDGVLADVEEMITVANKRWSKEVELERSHALKKEEKDKKFFKGIYNDDVPF